MKILKLPLGIDQKTYTLCTFNMLELTAMRREYKQFAKLEEEADRINFVIGDDGKLKKGPDNKPIVKDELTEKEKERLEEIEDWKLNFGLDVFRKIICKKHPEFKKHTNKEMEEEVKSKVMELVDPNDLRKIINFAFTGLFQKEENVIDFSLGGDDEEVLGAEED